MTALLAVQLIDGVERTLGIAALVMTVGTGFIAAFVGMHRRGKQLSDMAEALLGQKEARDRSGAVIRDPQPGLAAQVKELRDGMQTIAGLGPRIEELERTQGKHAARLVTLEDAALERTVTRIESVQHLATVERALHATPGDDTPPEGKNP